MLTLSSGELEAVFVPEAGMVGRSLRHRGEELLGQRGGLEAYVRERKTMGIPLLHPWANRLSRTHFELLGRSVDDRSGEDAAAARRRRAADARPAERGAGLDRRGR